MSEAQRVHEAMLQTRRERGEPVPGDPEFAAVIEADDTCPECGAWRENGGCPHR